MTLSFRRSEMIQRIQLKHLVVSNFVAAGCFQYQSKSENRAIKSNNEKKKEWHRMIYLIVVFIPDDFKMSRQDIVFVAMATDDEVPHVVIDSLTSREYLFSSHR